MFGVQSGHAMTRFRPTGHEKRSASKSLADLFVFMFSLVVRANGQRRSLAAHEQLQDIPEQSCNR